MKKVALVCLLKAALTSCTVTAFEEAAVDYTSQDTTLFPDSKIDSYVSVDDLVSITDIGAAYDHHFSLSPDGRYVSLQTTTARLSQNDYDTKLIVIDRMRANRVRSIDGLGELQFHITPNGYRGGTLRSVKPKWSPDSRKFAYLRKENGIANIWVYDTAKEKPFRVAAIGANIEDFVWTDDGERIFFRFGPSAQYKETTDQIEGERGFLFTRNFYPWISLRPQWSSCSPSARFSELLEGLPEDRLCTLSIGFVEPGTGMLSLVSEQDQSQFKDLFVDKADSPGSGKRHGSLFTEQPSGSAIAWVEDTDPERHRLDMRDRVLHFSRSGAIDESVRCDKAACAGAISRLFWRNRSDEVILMRRHGVALSKLGVYALSIGNGDLRTVLETSEKLTNCHVTEDVLICLKDTLTHPAVIVEIDLNDGSEAVIYDPNASMRRHSMPRVERLEWQDAFGNPTFGHLVYPAGYVTGQQYPMVVVQYVSRGFLRGGTGDEYPILPLSAEGMFVLRFDRPGDWQYAGSPRSLLESEKAEWNALYEMKRAQTALETVVNLLVARGQVDPTRVGITGLSDGASTLFYSLVVNDLFSAAAASSGAISESWYYLSGISFWHEDYLKGVGLGAPGTSEGSMWQEFSMEANAHKVTAPLLINTADNELVSSSVQTFVALHDADRPVAMHVFPDEYHVKWQPVHRYNIYRRNIQWFQFWFQNKEVDDPVDPEQYARWRKMRDDHCSNLNAEGEQDLPVYCEAA